MTKVSVVPSTVGTNRSGEGLEWGGARRTRHRRGGRFMAGVAAVEDVVELGYGVAAFNTDGHLCLIYISGRWSKERVWR